MLQYFQNIKKDVWVVILIVFVSTYTIFNLKHWNKESHIIAWDVVSYYGYLPATFIYGDVSLENPNEKFDEYQHIFWMETSPNGAKVFKTSMGMSFLYAPFFFASHIYATATGKIANGYTAPYKFGIAMSSLCFMFIGFLFLRKLLRKYFSSNVVALTLLFIGLGTNYYYYTVIAVGMPHIYLFGLLAATIYYTTLWHENPTFKISALLGCLIGLMILVRPTMLIVLLFPLLYHINTLKKTLLLYQKHLVLLLFMFVFSCLVWIPQLAYWKYATGNFLYYSYSEEGFYFTDPQIFNVLFSFRKGWLLYTPMMAFALIGFILMIKKKAKNSYAFVIPVVIYFYVASCWWDWWFGGSFGQRTMIDVMPFLAIGLSFLIQTIVNLDNTIYHTTILTLMVCILGFNLFQTRQAHEGLIHFDSMTKAAYFKIAFKLEPQITREQLKPYLKKPNYEAAKKGDRDK